MLGEDIKRLGGIRVIATGGKGEIVGGVGEGGGGDGAC